MGSGKDTVAEMINELSMHNWEDNKFADTLKDFTCTLIGCTRDDLEDRDFKERALGEGCRRVASLCCSGHSTQLYQAHP